MSFKNHPFFQKIINMKVLTKTAITLFSVLLFTAYTFAQEVDIAKLEQQFFNAYLKNSIPAWKISLSQLEDSQDESLQLLLAKSYYGAAGAGMGNQDEDFASEMLDKAAILTKSILEQDKKSAEANALLSAVYGIKIGLSPIKGMLLGSKSSSAAAKGVKLAPENPFTNFVKGINLFYTPAMFGGDTRESLSYFEKSKIYYEKNAQTMTWEYLNMLTTLGQAYHSEKLYEKAKTTYETALKVAPDFGYVKYRLLPRTEKALAKPKRA